jgi:crotonobetainyl-CoA:carnitine CoA-transferase CaiB-like acyl-CoA transferase
MGGPLEGLRVIDLTHALAGPYATMMLTDLGADVIKVEPPDGDVTRPMGPFRDDDEQRVYGGYFHSINRGKRSIVLDLKTEQGVATLLELVADAEVVIENFSVGVMERLGLSYERLREVNPRLVYGSLRGFGDPRMGESPYATWPAMDIVIQAMAGALSITGTEAGEPMKIGPGVGDIFPGTQLALGVLAAVLHARQTGQGQHVDIAMYDSILSLCERIVYQYSYTGNVPKPEGNKHPFLSPFDVVRTRDGWVTVAAPTPPRWVALCNILGRPELIHDDRYDTNLKRAQRRDEVRAIVEDWTSVRTKSEVVELLGGFVPVGPVNDVTDIFADEHARSRGMLVEVEHPGAAEPVVLAGQPLKFSETPSGVRGRGPLLGEHGDEVRDELQRRQAAARATS